MKSPQSRIGLLSCSLLLTHCLTSEGWTSFVLVLPPDLFDDSHKFYYPERWGDQTVTLSLSGMEVFVPYEHNPLPDPMDFAFIAKLYAIREEKLVVSYKPYLRQTGGFVSSRPPRVLGVGAKKHRKQINKSRRR